MSAGQPKMSAEGSKDCAADAAVATGRTPVNANKLKRFFLSRFKSKDPEPAPAAGAFRRRTSSVGNEDEVASRKKSVPRYPGIESEPKSAPNL